MWQDEHEEYGADSRELIEGLRRLASAIETPADLLPDILARSQQLLPTPQTRRPWWRRGDVPWPWRPLVWGPVIAVVCFVAGTFVSPPSFGPRLPAGSEDKKAPLSEWRQAPTPEPPAAAPPSEAQPMPLSPGLLAKDEAEDRAPLPSVPKSMLRHEAAARRNASRVAQTQAPTAASSARLAEPAEVEVTLTVSPELYARLAQAALEHNVPLSTLLRQIIEAHPPEKK